MMAVPNTTYVNPNDNSTCGVPGTDSWMILRAPVGSDMPWPGFLFGQTPASIWYWCADQVLLASNNIEIVAPIPKAHAKTTHR